MVSHLGQILALFSPHTQSALEVGAHYVATLTGNLTSCLTGQVIG